jgi:hypothetical protein
MKYSRNKRGRQEVKSKPKPVRLLQQLHCLEKLIEQTAATEDRTLANAAGIMSHKCYSP